MVNAMTKVVSFLTYIGALGAGIGIGVLCSRQYFAKRESERADKEIESMKESMRKTYIKEEKASDICADETNATPKHEIPSFREYHTYSEATDIRAEAERPRDDEENKKPYFIDIDDFDSVTLGYAKKELSYYMDDGTLVDEEENVLSIIDTVGGSNLDSFENSLESSCYIRNEALKEDYEISKVFGSFGSMMGDD
jgi:hypothetical protein